MSRRTKVALAVAVLAIGLLGVRFARMASQSQRTAAGGPAGGALADCPDRPNCVASGAASPDRRVDPLVFEGEPAEAVATARRTIESMPRSRVTRVEDGYLHAEFRSALFGFVDDLELLWRPGEGHFEVRSASRVGHSDLGVNRRRVERLRRRLAAVG